MPLLGAHMSIAGGFDKAVVRAAEAGCQTLQIFTTAPQKWPVPLPTSASRPKRKAVVNPVPQADAVRFREALAEYGIGHPIVHDSYLINLAAPDDLVWRRSIEALVLEMHKAEALGIPYVVAHPGAFTTSSEEAGLARIAAALDEVHQQTSGHTQCLLETTAGQGSNLGWRFEHLAAIIEQVAEPDRLGVCLDTCHVFAAGYGLKTRKDYLATIRAFDQVIGLTRLKAFHLNDSVREQGSRVDRHAHIGEGCLGLEPFRHLLNDRRFRNVPMYLETPKGTRDGEDLDVINLRTLRSLVK